MLSSKIKSENITSNKSVKKSLKVMTKYKNFLLLIINNKNNINNENNKYSTIAYIGA